VINVDIKVFIKYGIELSLEEIDTQISHMQNLIFSECSFIGDEQFKCKPNKEIFDIIFNHLPLNEALEPEVLSTIILDIAEDLALWILENATLPLDARMAGLFSYDFIYQAMKNMFHIDLYEESLIETTQQGSADSDTHDPMFG
jgi:hypothetical protein